MKCLRINEGKGEFSLDGSSYLALDTIDKDSILKLVDIALDEDEDFEMDDFDSEAISNPAHRIIYSNLHQKFRELSENKQQFNNEVSDLYKDAYEKYTSEDVDKGEENLEER